MMKTNVKNMLLGGFIAILSTLTLHAQDTEPADSTGMPGDNFSLEGAIELFKKSESLEDFEKRLNAEDSNVNNLDLNEDDKTDYIRVVDRMEGDVHAIVLQVPIDEKESQDIAVIELEKTGAETAVLQIVGDEELYGKETIAEPYEEEATMKKGGKNGPAVAFQPVAIVVNVWLWPSVRWVYRPAYVAYVSPWRWAYYPTWYRPFRPRPWGVYHVRVRPYHAHCHFVTTRRVVRAHAIYAPHRSHATVVQTRSVTKVNGRRGRGVVRKTETTTVRGPRGKVQRQTTTVHRGGGGRRH
ncbi:MAG: hypothetical protein WCR52_21715 [Bacteroidota bacterium]